MTHPARKSGPTLVAVATMVVASGCSQAVTTATSPATTVAAEGDVVDLVAASPQSVSERVQELLERMTLDEKIGQMTLVEKGSITPAEVEEYHVGAILSGGGGSPRPNTPEAWREMVGSFQQAALSSRLGIPILYGVDAVHGHNNLRGATIFPHDVGLGATRDAALVEEVGRITAAETAATGIRWTYAPVLAVPQDIRWGRTYEAFGEDPALVAELGAAMIRGLQGADLASYDSVLATPKHFVGDGGTEWGTSTVYQIDQGVTSADDETLRDVHLRPYRDAFDAGAITVMASYSGWENGKVHGDGYLLTDVLRGELGFEGLVVSDWAAVDQVIPGDYYGSVVQSVNAGIDLVMVPSEFELFQTALRGAVEQGDVPSERIDEAVRRILSVKFAAGLFDTPLPPSSAVAMIGSDEHRAVARRAVAESMVVLQTSEGVLPIDDGSTRVLLGGAAADDIGIQSGGWTISWQGGAGDVTEGTTIYEGLRDTFGNDSVAYDRFGRFDQRAPIGVAVIGERPYAEGQGDSASLRLPEREIAIVESMRSQVDTLVVVVISGRPMILDDIVWSADAVVAAWLPGTEGQGVVDVLTGAAPVTGVLPFGWPESMRGVGHGLTGDCDGLLFPYGFGLDTSGAPIGDAVACGSLP